MYVHALHAEVLSLAIFFAIQIRTADQAWQYIDKVLIEHLYSPVFYNGRPHGSLRGFVTDYQNHLVGEPRLRQLRIKPSGYTAYRI